MSDIASIDLLWSRLAESVLSTHPNDVSLSNPSKEWEIWWDAKWTSLINYYTTGGDSTLPEALRCFVDDIKSHQIARNPVVIEKASGEIDVHGMSPKKAHEVHRMTAYIGQLLDNVEDRTGVRIKHVVDVGSGQGYLSLALARTGLNVLALDSNEWQTSGAKSRQTRSKGKGKAKDLSPELLTHITTHITAETLLAALDEWTVGHEPSTPVLVVALHACGSLTPEILRGFVSATRRAPGSKTWYPKALVGVGCCYNLMASHDFPLSKKYTTLWNLRSPTPHLPEPWLHLAAQIPDAWTRTPDTIAAASLAIRKVVWRALLVPVIRQAEAKSPAVHREPERIHPGTSINPNLPRPVPRTASAGISTEVQRLGRLNDAAYVDWETFVRRAEEKMGVEIDVGILDEGGDFGEGVLASRLEVLHVLRCLLGPLVETVILRDRAEWLREQLGEGRWEVDLVNLFDQATGSGRNVGIVIIPR